MELCPILKLVIILGLFYIILCLLKNDTENFSDKMNLLNSCHHDNDCQGWGCVRNPGLRDRNITHYKGDKVCAMIPSGCNHAGGPSFCKCINKHLAKKIANGQKVLRFNG